MGTVGDWYFPANVYIQNGMAFSFADTSGNLADFILQNDNNFVFYGTNASGVGRPIWDIIQHSSSSVFDFEVPVQFNSSVSLNGTNLSLGSASVICWNGDTGLSRLASGTVGIGTCTSGNVSGTVEVGAVWVNTSVTPSISLPTSGTQFVTYANVSSPRLVTTLIGDGTGWQWQLTSRSGGVNTPRIGFTDTGVIGFYNSTPTLDAGISRSAPATINFGNGTASDSSATLNALAYNAVQGGQATFIVGPDANGGIELGPSNKTGTGNNPYIDYHFHDNSTTFDGQDFNVRLINDANGRMTLNFGALGSPALVLRLGSTGATFQISSDIGISRGGSNIINFGNGTQGDATATINVGSCNGCGSKMLSHSGASGTITANGTAQTVYTFTVPAKTLTTGCIRLNFIGNHLTGTNSVSWNLTFGSSSFPVIVSSLNTISNSVTPGPTDICFNGATNSQLWVGWFPGWVGTTNQGATGTFTSAIDTTVSQTVSVTAQGTAPDTFKGLAFDVELIQ